MRKNFLNTHFIDLKPVDLCLFTDCILGFGYGSSMNTFISSATTHHYPNLIQNACPTSICCQTFIMPCLTDDTHSLNLITISVFSLLTCKVLWSFWEAEITAYPLEVTNSLQHFLFSVNHLKLLCIFFFLPGSWNIQICFPGFLNS